MSSFSNLEYIQKYSVCFQHLVSQRCSGEPADGRLAVRRSFRRAQGLADLCLRQTEWEATDLELFGKLSHLVQVHSVDLRVGARTADRVYPHQEIIQSKIITDSQDT